MLQEVFLQLHQQEGCSHQQEEYYQQEVFAQQEDTENKDQNTQQDVHLVNLVLLQELAQQVNEIHVQMDIIVLEQLIQTHLDNEQLDTIAVVDQRFQLKM